MKRLGILVVLATLLVVAIPAVALAQAYSGTTPPVVGSQDVNVLGVKIVAPQQAQVKGVKIQGGALPVTGADVAGLALIALVLISMGVVMQRRSPADRATTTS